MVPKLVAAFRGLEVVSESFSTTDKTVSNTTVCRLFSFVSTPQHYIHISTHREIFIYLYFPFSMGQQAQQGHLELLQIKQMSHTFCFQKFSFVFGINLLFLSLDFDE